MKKEISKIQVVETDSLQVLFECSMEESEKAYAYAASLEEMGVDVVVKAPTLSRTLSESLGLSAQDLRTYEESMEEELEHHEGGCCSEKLNSPEGLKH